MNISIEKNALKVNGFLVFIFFLGLAAFLVYMFIQYASRNQAPPIFNIVLLAILGVLLNGFSIVKPNQASVLTFFGKYIGTIKDNGFWYKMPFSMGQTVSLKARNFESPKLKVNDLHGNPIEIGGVITWRVYSAAKAVFDVELYEDYVATQSETAIRFLASHYPYDAENHEISLRGSTDQVCDTLKKELSKILKDAGIEVIDAKLTHLAYSPEIAQAMLRRQQAQAIIAARKTIVEGAVSMVDMALQKLSEHNIVDLDNERKAIMVNNLLVTLVSENETKPVINTGTIY
ncbi:MAG: SPFH domain-containing protein [Candidatus Sericytochromatia bacterium]